MSLVFLTPLLLFARFRGNRRRGAHEPLRGLPSAIDKLAVAVPCIASIVLAVEACARVFPIVDSLAVNPGVTYFWPEFFDKRNSLGWNEREPGPKRARRILVLGDSYVEGAGVSKPERFTAQLEALYRADDLAVEVLNAGACGMDTMDEALRLEESGDRVSPDLVVVGYCINDAEGPEPASKEPPSAMTTFFLRDLKSYAYYRFWQIRFLFGPDYRETVGGQHGSETEGWRRVRAGFDKFATWCRERGVRAVVIVFPLFAPRAEHLRATMDKVVAEARSRGLEAWNTLDDFDGRWSELAVSSHDAHPGPEAHRIIAAELKVRIGKIE